MHKNNAYIEIKFMPESKARHPHKHTDHHQKTSNTHLKPKKVSRAVIAAVLFCGFLGLGVSYFIDSTSIATLITGALIGCIAGFIFGYLVNKSLSKK